jgi:hypothetical protein
MFSAWAFAQQPDTGKIDSGHSGAKTTVKGCLSKTDSGFELTDKSGTRFELAGDTSKLADHVGHQVQISGRSSAESAVPQSDQPAKAGSATSKLEVSKVKHISETCGTDSTSPSSKPPSTEKPMSEKPMSEKPPIPPR